jgi:hypothetical protein
MANGKPGRPVGLPKTGGRTKGTPNKSKVYRELALKRAHKEIAQKISPELVKDLSPKAVMLLIMKMAIEQENIPLALQAAEKVAPYVHQKLANTEVHATIKRPAKEMSDDELASIIAANSRIPAADQEERDVH